MRSVGNRRSTASGLRRGTSAETPAQTKQETGSRRPGAGRAREQGLYNAGTLWHHRSMDTERLRSTAVHEAAHFIIGNRLRAVIPDTITVVPNKEAESLGHVSADSPLDYLGSRDRADRAAGRAADRYVVCLLAGGAAQRLLCPDVDHIGDRSDRCNAVGALAYVSLGLELRRRYRRLRAATERYVRRPRIRAAIERLASALLRQPTMEGQLADTIASAEGLTWDEIARHLPDGPLDRLWVGHIWFSYRNAGAI